MRKSLGRTFYSTTAVVWYLVCERRKIFIDVRTMWINNEIMDAISLRLILCQAKNLSFFVFLQNEKAEVADIPFHGTHNDRFSPRSQCHGC